MKPNQHHYNLGSMQVGPVDVELQGTPVRIYDKAMILSYEIYGVTIQYETPPDVNSIFIPWSAIKTIVAA